MNYTIGQRRGLGLSFPEPRYVKKILPKDNKIIVSKKDGLFSKTANVKNLNWLNEIDNFPLSCKARIRYNSIGAQATLNNKNNKITCIFDEPQLVHLDNQFL